MMLGYATANVVTIRYEYLPFIGIFIGRAFILFFFIKHKRKQANSKK